MGNLFLVISITTMIALMVLITIVVWCCLYVGAKSDIIMHMLANEYIEEKSR